jgi:hypothetical protein
MGARLAGAKEGCETGAGAKLGADRGAVIIGAAGAGRDGMADRDGAGAVDEAR